jgi:hypothetical protein
VALVNSIQKVTPRGEYRDLIMRTTHRRIETDDRKQYQSRISRLVCVSYEDAIIDESLGTSLDY